MLLIIKCKREGDLMLINIEIYNLYGKNYKINFNSDLTLLYGLNGSGKTTILNILYNILEGNIKQVCGYSFDRLDLNFKEKAKLRKLRIMKFNHIYEVYLDDEFYSFQEVEDKFNAVIKPKTMTEDLEESSDYLFVNNLVDKVSEYKMLSYEQSQIDTQKKMVAELKSLCELVYIPLDRRVKVTEDVYIRNSTRPRLGNSNKKNIDESLYIAEMYFKSYWDHINRVENMLNIQLRNQILKQLSTPFDDKDILDVFDINTNSFIGIVKDLQYFIEDDVYENVESLLKKFSKTSSSYQYYKDEIKILNASQFMIHSFTLAQLSKLKNVAELAKSRKVYLDKQKNNADNILLTINSLFNDTEKEIRIDNHRKRNLYFNLLNSNKQISLSYLSSGEKQLVIFFIFSLIQFKNAKNKVLLIDEPELSLHVEWQSKLLPLIMGNNERKQIIIATHSPDIIGDFYDRCVEVKGVLS